MSAGAFRMMCYAIINCDTLSKAIKRLIEFLEVFYDQELHLELTKDGDVVTLSYPHYRETEMAKGHAGEAYGLALWHRFFSWLIGLPIEIQGVRLLAPQPSNPSSYKRLFGMPVEFHSTKNGFDFSARFLELPIAQNENSLREFLRNAPYQMMVEPQEAETSELISNVRRIMGYDLSQGFPAFEEVASAMNMSPPTLRRHLRKEGVSYQGLKDQCRKEAAIAYLSRPELSVSAIAALMGFTDPSAFHRSFKKWTILTPGQYRLQEFSIEERSE
jgi:AraC-like DNA-binding protein